MTADEPESFGDRHHRADPDGKLNERAEHASAAVIVEIEPAFALTRAGQLGAWLCVNLLARLDGLVSQISVSPGDVAAIPELTTLGPPTRERASLGERLSELCLRVSGARTRVVPVGALGPSTKLRIVLGSGLAASIGASVASLRTIWCFGRGWRSYVGSEPPIGITAGDDYNPLGVYLAVCDAVAEVFKQLRGYRRHVKNAVMHSVYSSLWTGVTADSWAELEDGLDIRSVQLPATYLVGAGAVGQAVAFAAATSGVGIEFLTVIDGEDIDRTNRNRYMLALRSDEGAQKARFLAQFLTRWNVRAHGEPLHWSRYLDRLERHPFGPLADKERRLSYELVLSCVDKNTARHEVQRSCPKVLLGGSTHSLRAMAVHYDLNSPSACLACHNDIPVFQEVIDRLQADLASLPQESDRREYLARSGFAEDKIEAVLEYLREPKCGEVGRDELIRYAEEGPPTFSVGFVSVAAGLLLSRHWIRCAVSGDRSVASSGRHYLNINFQNGRFIWTEQAKKEGCWCDNRGRDLWQRLWNQPT